MANEIDPHATNTPDSDDRLIHGVLDGDEHAFRALYRRHTPRLRQLVLRLVGEPHADADDVVQETWMRAVMKLSGFRGASSFRTWLIGIGVRTAHETLRRRKRRRETGSVELFEPAGSPPMVADHIDLERALASLGAPHRTVLLLHDLEGFTHEEIGRQLGIAIGTSKSHLFRARRAMRDALDHPREATRDSAI